MSSPLGRRARKALESRDRIVECAAALFATRGYDATTMDDIGECADVSRATVFNYFPRKEDLVLAWFNARRTNIAGVLAGNGEPAVDASTRLRQAFHALARIFEDDPRAGRGMVRSWLHAGGPLLTPDSDTSQLFAHTIRAGQADGELAQDIDPVHAGQILFDAYQGELFRWVIAEDSATDLEKRLAATVDLLLRGIAVPAPRVNPRARRRQ
jgi:TetR/AcrR family transcriptional regulator, cholesterol catabolism regulator